MDPTSGLTLITADDYKSKVLSVRGGAGQRVGYIKTGPRASPNRITQNHTAHATPHLFLEQDMYTPCGETASSIASNRFPRTILELCRNESSNSARQKPWHTRACACAFEVQSANSPSLRSHRPQVRAQCLPRSVWHLPNL